MRRSQGELPLVLLDVSQRNESQCRRSVHGGFVVFGQRKLDFGDVVIIHSSSSSSSFVRIFVPIVLHNRL